MAKQYVKPVIAFEPLELNSDFSSGCTVELQFAEFSCPVLIPEWGETVFNNTCDWSNDDFNVCYHVPTASFNVFGS